MPPQPLPTANSPSTDRFKRQARPPALPHCVSVCMMRGNMANCNGPTDYKCLCTDQTYLSSVYYCWQVSCSDDEIQTGKAYSATGCSMFGVKPGNGTSGADSPVATNLAFPPVVYSPAAHNIQIVMSTVCSIALALAILVAVINCRNQLRREELTASRWTAVSGTLSGDSKNRGFRSQTSSGGQTMSHFLRSDGRPAGPLDTITSEDGATFALPLPRPAPAAGPSLNRPNRGQGVPVRTLAFPHPAHSSHARFTNRVAPEDGELWELREMRPSPTDASSGMDDDPKGKGKAVDKHSDGYSDAAFSSLRHPPSSFGGDEPSTPTTSHVVSEYGSTTNLRKVAGERD